MLHLFGNEDGAKGCTLVAVIVSWHYSGADADTLGAFLESLEELKDESDSGQLGSVEDVVGGLTGGRSDCKITTTPSYRPSQDGAAVETQDNQNFAHNQVNSVVDEVSGGRCFKDIYHVDPAIDSVSLPEVVKLKKRLGIETMGVRVPKPLRAFTHLSSSVPPALMKRFSKLGYTEPTPMQCQAMPILLQGRNAILMGESGCGKTLSYLIPLVCHTLNLIRETNSAAPKRSAFCVIMALTREACGQIFIVLSKLVKSFNVRVATVTTGYDNYNQVVSGTEFLVVTPAKLCDLLNCRSLLLSNTYAVVLEDFAKVYRKHADEAEMLLNQRNAMKVIVSNVMLGAGTLTVIRQYLKCSVTVKYVASTTLSHLNLKWIACLKEPSKIQKTSFLSDLLSHFHQAFRMVIFANEKITVEHIYSFITNITDSVEFVHEGLSKDVLTATLERFRTGGLQILVSTDMLTNHINLPQVDYVVMFDMPRLLSKFCGRVNLAQMSEKGAIYNLLTKRDHIICSSICCQLAKESLELPRVLEQVALNWKPYRDLRQQGKDPAMQIQEHQELEIDMRGASSKGNITGSLVPANSAEHTSPAKINCTKGDGVPSHGTASSEDRNMESDTGREYGIEDIISSDEDADTVPKRQLVKSSGLIDLEKLKRRRSKMLQEEL
ncbi:DEAD-box ATP-dependent RNA helicase 24 [Babesia sp. Xinjiang]|uniref:DEAD-box ATP-dependent RNA helicase 24 n=1 Tax=Babesia sp. Xinjiang TaxID=462227 RepID=UPI000A249BC8|nr:DEAD-box ATP-dependent RNA helicase 24 [Babesia sp. Xinjiang]ORM40640.1 DEAD-box ATP-dependent RNA helicase 24 [Babesia sp. Xinjiang]